MSTESKNHHTFYSNALGSATAGIISRILTHPLDTAKARLQAPISVHPPYSGVKDVLLRTYTSEGVLPLYRGFSAVVVGGTPGTMAYLCGYEWVKNQFEKRDNVKIPEFVIHFSSGMLAETFACIIYVPVDVIKERLQVQISNHDLQCKSNEYNGSVDALKKILRTEGLGGIYKGYGATLASFGPFSAFYFLFYEQLKSLSRDFVPYYKSFANQFFKKGNMSLSENKSCQNEQNEIPFPFVVLSSASAGAAASWITSPLDMAKLRLQIQRSAAHSSNQPSHIGMKDCLSYIYKQDGLRGLFRGAGARVIHFTPATAISMTCFETCRSIFSSYV